MGELSLVNKLCKLVALQSEIIDGLFVELAKRTPPGELKEMVVVNDIAIAAELKKEVTNHE